MAATDAPPDPTHARPRASRWALALLAAGAAAAVRLATWGWVLGGPEVRIVGDGDVLYHLLQAGRLLGEGFGAVWRDPLLNFPAGADVPWPPLFDGLVALSGWLAAGGARPDAAALLAGSIWLPVVLGVAGVLLLARLGGALLGGAPWLDAAVALGLLPAHACVTVLGRADQHALEPILLCLVLLGAAGVARGGRRGARALLAAGAALAFWNWNGSALYLALVAGFAAALHAAAPPGDDGVGRTALGLAQGLLSGAIVLAASVALLGAPGALGRAGLSGLTGLQPALVAGSSLACAAVALARRLRPAAALPERLATAAGALLLPPAALLLLPWTRDGIQRGLAMLGAGGWYRYIQEFRPPVPSGVATLGADLGSAVAVHGLAPLAVLAALPLAWARWRRAEPAARGPALLFGVTALGLLLLGAARNRFGVYLALAEALAVALVAREAAARAAARWPAARLAGPAAGLALGALLLAPVLPSIPGGAYAPIAPERYADWAPVARLAGRTPPAPGLEAVQAPWNMGHDVRYFAGRPVVSSPFGVEGGPGALEADAAFHRAVEQGEAEALLEARRAGLVVVSQPLAVAVSLEAFAPAGAPPVTAHGPDEGRLDDVVDLPAFRRLVAARLWLWDGQFGDASGRRLDTGLAPLDAFRLLGEGATPMRWRAVEVAAVKLFQRVPGARVAVRGLRPGARLEASVTLVTDRGRRVDWPTRATAGADGVARLRLPYATGMNGAVLAGPWRLGDGPREVALPVPERAVLGGEALEATLGP